MLARLFFWMGNTKNFIKTKKNSLHLGLEFAKEKKDSLLTKLKNHLCLKHILLISEPAYCLAAKHERNQLVYCLNS